MTAAGDDAWAAVMNVIHGAVARYGSPRYQAMVDQRAAQARDVLDELGVTIADPEQVRAVLAGCFLLSDWVSSACDLLMYDAEAELAALTGFGVMGTILEPYLPEEIRGAAG